MKVRIAVSVILTGVLSIAALASDVTKVAPIEKLQCSMDSSALFKKSKQLFVKKSINHADEPPFMNGEPNHLRIQFDNDKLSDYVDYLQRQLLVYPIDSYAQLFHGKEKQAFDKVIPALKKISQTHPATVSPEISCLPTAEAAQLFRSQIKYLKFKNGAGVAFVTRYAQDITPTKNGDLFYTYQGITDDGKYYVALYYPVNAPGLPANAPIKKSTAYLDKLERNKFKPDLDQVDKLIQSISIK